MIGMVAKSMFFDRKAVLGAVDRATRKVLSRFGAFVRTTARHSIRRRKAVSQPGQPPTNRTGTLKRFIWFAYEPAKRSVIIGPAKTNQVFFDGDGRPVKGTVPEVLEDGGSIFVREVFKWGAWRRADLRSRRRLAGLPTRLRKVNIAARPYMGPAFAKEKPKLPSLWADSVKP